MKTSRISVNILLAFCICGCSSKLKYVELDKETFSKLDASRVVEVNVVSTGATPAEWKNPTKWTGVYRNVFPIKEPNKIDTIVKCIREAESFPELSPGMKTPFDRMFFRTQGNTIYFIGIRWDNESVHGDWWNSRELREYLRQLGIERPKGESNLPPSKIWKESPFPPMDAK